MHITNSHNIPETLVSAIKNDPYHQDGHISVTSLIAPPRIRCLKARHDDAIQEDVTDRIWALLGQAVHGVLERAEVTDSIQEKRLAAEIMGWKITGQADLWEKPATLSDYKVTSTWAVIGNPKPEWITQLNIYGWLFRQHGYPVNELQIVAICRDWSKNQAMRSGNGYPQCQVKVVPIPLWSDADTLEYIQSRVALHQQAETLEDNALPLCTPEERWERPTKWAVMKKGRKSAVKLFDDEDGAKAMVKELGKPHSVECRPGESVRCQGYCPVRDFCNQYREMF